jgi:hypothetical protein
LFSPKQLATATRLKCNCNAIINANKLASEIDIPIIFKRCRIRKKKMFSYEHNDEPILNEEDNFRINYFIVVVNQ